MRGGTSQVWILVTLVGAPAASTYSLNTQEMPAKCGGESVGGCGHALASSIYSKYTKNPRKCQPSGGTSEGGESGWGVGTIGSL